MHFAKHAGTTANDTTDSTLRSATAGVGGLLETLEPRKLLHGLPTIPGPYTHAPAGNSAVASDTLDDSDWGNGGFDDSEWDDFGDDWGGDAPTGEPEPLVLTYFDGELPESVLGGSKGKATILMTNEGDAAQVTPLDVILYVSDDQVLDESDRIVTKLTNRPTGIAAGGDKSYPISFNYPSDVEEGEYYLLAEIVDSGTQETVDLTISDTTVTIEEQHVDLLATSVSLVPGSTRAGSKATVLVTVRNDGNITSRSGFNIDWGATAIDGDDAADFDIATLEVKKLTLKPGQTKTFKKRVYLPDEAPAGTYAVNATVDPDGNVDEVDIDNNYAESDVTFEVLSKL